MLFGSYRRLRERYSLRFHSDFERIACINPPKGTRPLTAMLPTVEHRLPASGLSSATSLPSFLDLLEKPLCVSLWSPLREKSTVKHNDGLGILIRHDKASSTVGSS